MAEYIERDAAVKAAQGGADEWDGGYNRNRDIYIEVAIDKVPAADVRPVVHGYWIQNYETDDGRQLRCSECGMVYWVGKGRDGNFCPNCGARMDEDG